MGGQITRIPHTCGNGPQGPRILSDAIATDSQTNEMGRLSCEVQLQHQDIKGTLNKVVDVLSRDYEHDYWTNVPELHDYINTNIRLDPEHDDLPREGTLKIEGQVIENRVQKMNSAKIQQRYVL